MNFDTEWLYLLLHTPLMLAGVVMYTIRQNRANRTIAASGLSKDAGMKAQGENLPCEGTCTERMNIGST